MCGEKPLRRGHRSAELVFISAFALSHVLDAGGVSRGCLLNKVTKEGIF
jgi:hypothetical protein